jgi:hypothetical protein
MSQTIQFHLDENVNNAVADGLRRRGINVTTTGEAGLISAPDELQLQFAISQNRTLITHDDDFLAMHQGGVEHTGIAYCKPNSRSIGEILCALILIWEVLEPEDMSNHIEFL